MLHSMEANEIGDPVAISFLGAKAIALNSGGSLHPLQQCHWLPLFIILMFLYIALVSVAHPCKHASLGYSAKIFFALKLINGVESIGRLQTLN